MLYWFQLWREFRLSIAEILSVFSWVSVIYSWKSVLILDWLKKEDVLRQANNLGWTIKIFELELKTSKNDILQTILDIVSKKEWKINYGFNLFPEKQEKIKKYLIDIKRFLQKFSISSRYVNKMDKNLTSAQIIWNSILKKGFDFNLVDLWGIFYFWKTIWVQDIDSYSSRDYGKSRDMQTWMLPVKLAQMMINFSRINWVLPSKIYDPFVWLGTILIEAKNMWIKDLYASDLNEEILKKAKNNIWEWLKQEKLNAKFVNEFKYFSELKKDSAIVTESYLWEIMTNKNISLDRINKQKESLKKIYEGFFSSLKKWWFSWVIVLSIAFWNFNWKYIFQDDVYKIIEKYCKILPFFSKEFDFKETKSGSLLYKRPKQLVWREIFKLALKD